MSITIHWFTMARKQDKEKAIILRKQGKSYSQIKTELGISKSTLSGWLKDYPLSHTRIQELRGSNPGRIEKFRSTMAKKRDNRLQQVLEQVKNDIQKISDRELFLTGLFLYWAEGTKRARYTVAMANTDPNMLRFFMVWMESMGVAKTDLRIKLHLYSDMDQHVETAYWIDILGVTKKQFNKPYIKESTLSGLSYKNGFGHGTCNVSYGNRDLYEYVMMSLQYLRGVENYV